MEGVVRSKRERDRVGRILARNRIGVGGIQRAHARAAIAHENQVRSVPVAPEVQADFRLRREAGDDLLARNANGTQHSAAARVNVSQADRRGDTEAGIDRFVVPDGDVVVVSNRGSGRGGGIRQHRSHLQRSNGSLASVVSTAADDQ